MSTNEPPFATPVERVIMWIVGVSAVVLMAMTFTSCYTPKKATRQVLKAQTYHPEVVAKACADLFPIKETTVTKIVTKEGKTDTLHNYVLVDCDSVGKSTTNPTRIVRVPVYTTHKTDTVFAEHTVIQENTARVSQLTTEKQNERDARIKAEGKAKTWFWMAMALGAYTLARWVVKYFTGYSLP